MSTKHNTAFCDECVHHRPTALTPAQACHLGHRPRFFVPHTMRDVVLQNYGWKRRCADFPLRIGTPTLEICRRRRTLMTDHISTHADGCWEWGPKHYECAVREIKALREVLQVLVNWTPSADTYRRLGFDPEAPMRAHDAAKALLKKKNGND